MTQNIKNFIEKGEKEFKEKFIVSTKQGLKVAMTTGAIHDFEANKILKWHKQRQISLIKMIVEMVEEEKGKEDMRTWQTNVRVLDTITSKLKELIKE